jgi:hypothetical protein
LPDQYNLKEMPTASYPKRTEQNVIDSDGTLIIARGKLTGDTDYTRGMALKHKKQLLGVDLNQTSHQEGASLVASWIKLYRIKVLNVAGPSASEDSRIYTDAMIILAGAIQTLRNEERGSSLQPKTVAEAVERLESDMKLKDKSKLAGMSEDDLYNLHFSLGPYIRNNFLYPRNDALLESCRELSGDKFLHWDQAGAVILKELWKQLGKTVKLRVVK